MIGQPIDRLIVCQHGFAKLCRSDKPTFARILNQRIFTRPPAERVVVEILLLVEEFSLLPKSATDGLVRIFHPLAFVLRGDISELAIRSDRTEQVWALTRLKPFLLAHQHLVVHLTKRRCLMNHSRSTLCRHEICAHHLPVECLFGPALEFTRLVQMVFRVVVKGRSIPHPQQFTATAS